MTINKKQMGDRVVFDLEGRLDTITASDLQAVLLPEFDSAKAVELNFEKLTYVASAGLRVLLMGEKTAKKQGATLTITNVSTEIMEVFDMTGFTGILKIV